jgi:hypothetical protein
MLTGGPPVRDPKEELKQKLQLLHEEFEVARKRRKGKLPAEATK